MVNLLALAFSIIIGLAHYYSESIKISKKKKTDFSFGAGILLAYLILDLFPRIFLETSPLNNTAFLFVLLGFSLHHIIEKYIYQHAEKKRKLTELKEAHSVTFFIYYLIIGIILFKVTSQSVLDGLILFIPLLFHTTIGAISLKEIHHTLKSNKFIKIILSSSPIIGVLIASFIFIPSIVNHAFLSLIGGVLLYIITREVIPKENRGDTIDFLLGISVYAVLIVITWII